MYVPPKFAEDDPDVLNDFIDRHPFAILLSAGDPTPENDAVCQISHLPVIRAASCAGAGSPVVLHTHLAVPNPQARLRDGAPVTVIFTGPHGYVSPTWYETAPAVPTWNYSAVHAEGSATVLTDDSARRDVLRTLAQRFEGPGDRAWDFDALDRKFRDGQMKGIVALEIQVARLVGKFKLSQNRSDADRSGVVKNLEESARPDDHAPAELMRGRLGIL